MMDNYSELGCRIKRAEILTDRRRLLGSTTRPRRRLRSSTCHYRSRASARGQGSRGLHRNDTNGRGHESIGHGVLSVIKNRYRSSQDDRQAVTAPADAMASTEEAGEGDRSIREL